jgi:hypothetical protein
MIRNFNSLWADIAQAYHFSSSKSAAKKGALHPEFQGIHFIRKVRGLIEMTGNVGSPELK